MRRFRLALPLTLGLLLCPGCSDDSAAPGDADTTPLADAGPDVALDDAAPATASVTVTVADYPGASGKFLLVPVTVNGSAPINVLLDTGSSGLRVFASALAGTTVTKTTETTTTRFGGEVLFGYKATATVAIGDVTVPGQLAFDLVESFSCIPGDPYCDPATVGQYQAQAGIQGVIGVGLRAGTSGIHSPLAQLPSPLSDGFTLRTGGTGSKSGELLLGAPTLPGVATIALTGTGPLPSGVASWADDSIRVCYKVDGADTDPACSESVLDTGSNLDVLYANNLPASAVTGDGFLAPGVSFEATQGQALSYSFTVGSTVTWSVDGVLVQQDEAFTILGVGLFLRHDVAFDLKNGRIGLRAL